MFAKVSQVPETQSASRRQGWPSATGGTQVGVAPAQTSPGAQAAAPNSPGAQGAPLPPAPATAHTPILSSVQNSVAGSQTAIVRPPQLPPAIARTVAA